MRNWLFLIGLLLCSGYVWADEEDDSLSQASASHWWSGISFTPGIGLRHLGLDVERKSDGYNGNISQSLAAKLFFSLSITSPSYDFNEHWGLTLRSYSSVVTLDSQFFDYNNNAVAGSGEAQGERINVGTKVTGSYSYLVPTIHYKASTQMGTFAAALGVGYWTSTLSGDIILTSNNQPVEGMPTTPVDLSTKNKIAYLFFMSFTNTNEWIYEMTVGGPKFSADGYDYKLEEVSLTIGKRFVL